MAAPEEHPDEIKASAPARERRRGFGLEPLLTRLLVPVGVIGIGVALGAILRSSNTQGWEIGLIVAVVTMVLSWILWSASRR